MRNNRTIFAFLAMLLVGAIFILPARSQAQEHPEHPKEKKVERTAAITTESLAEAIAGYINKDASLKGGYFIFYDQKTNKPLLLTLEKVHKDKLSRVSEDMYFACTDLKEKGGKTYDFDFFMKSTDSGLQVSEIMLHKENGKPRYSWAEENGIWMRK
ncbi:MAG: hypothetical protein HY707_00470 [Ignavibacteriae bacterium]|nr:hypothetical protein [Ignavibacteriota bacterium]